MREADDTRHTTPHDTSQQDVTPDTPPDASPEAAPAILQVDAARRAGVSVRTIQRAIDRGNLAAARDGVHCWIRLDDLDRWQHQRTTRSATARVVARDIDASRGATFEAPADVTDDVSSHVTPHAARPDVDVERLQSEIADLKVERDRWHQAFERESALREEETRQLRLLIQQEQALSFSRLAAIEATTRHEPPAADAPPGTPDAPGSDAPGATSEIPFWRRWWPRKTGT